MRPLAGSIKRYDWGSPEAIPQILGIPADGQPLAEYWLGAHPMGPSSVDGVSLAQIISDYPAVVGDSARQEFEGRLPFLVKLLSAARPLSLQAHPTRLDAQAGFERENILGLALDAPERTYRDPWDKPELLVALTEFEALAGFRDPRASADLFSQLGLHPQTEVLFAPLVHRHPTAGLAEVFLDCLVLNEERHGAVTDVVTAAVRHLADPGELGEFARTAVLLDEHFPGDPSLLAALLLNRRSLHPGEALHLKAGTMHAYLCGTGVEVMGSSDNVLRGGLTTKHIDASALVQVVNFTPNDMPALHPDQEAPGLWHYPAGERAFAVWRLDLVPGRTIELPAESSGRILLVTKGKLGLSTGADALVLESGQAAFIGAGETVLASGEGQGFLSATGTDA